MEKILLNDLLGFSADKIESAKIKFNIINDSGTDPIEEYKSDPAAINDGWLLWHKKRRYFAKDEIAICFVRMNYDYDQWLLTGIKVIDELLDVEDDIGYKAHDIEAFKKYFGRVIVKYHKNSAACGIRFSTVMNDLEVLEVLNDQYTGDEFPGYENVNLTYGQLKTIIDRKLPGWYNALSNQKAVYLLTDGNTGKMYVGSATSKGKMLLDRWSSYADNGHGGNKELVELVKNKGFDYIKNNFHYIILENYNASIDDDYVLNRESWWKKALQTREFGYNVN